MKGRKESDDSTIMPIVTTDLQEYSSIAFYVAYALLFPSISCAARSVK